MRTPKTEVKSAPLEPKGKGGPKSKPTIHNVFILDCSGSMGGGKYDSAVRGIREEMNELAKDSTANYTQTITCFDNHINQLFTKLSIDNAVKEFKPMRVGSTTALFDAIGITLSSLKNTLSGKEGDGKYLVKIFTDGGENASREWTGPRTNDLIKECEAKGFTITFIGTEADVATVIKNLGVDATNTLSHNNTVEGVAASFDVMRGATMAYSKNVADGKDVKTNFFTKTVE